MQLWKLCSCWLGKRSWIPRGRTLLKWESHVMNRSQERFDDNLDIIFSKFETFKTYNYDHLMNRCIKCSNKLNRINILWYVNDWLKFGRRHRSTVKVARRCPPCSYTQAMFWLCGKTIDQSCWRNQTILNTHHSCWKWKLNLYFSNTQMLSFRRWPRFPRLLLPDAALKAPVIEVFRGTVTFGIRWSPNQHHKQKHVRRKPL